MPSDTGIRPQDDEAGTGDAPIGVDPGLATRAVVRPIEPRYRHDGELVELAELAEFAVRSTPAAAERHGELG